MADNHYNIDTKSPALVAIGFSDPEDALKFLGACGALAALDPEDVDANDLILTIKRSAKTFAIYTKDPNELKRLEKLELEGDGQDLTSN